MTRNENNGEHATDSTSERCLGERLDRDEEEGVPKGERVVEEYEGKRWVNYSRWFDGSGEQSEWKRGSGESERSGGRQGAPVTQKSKGRPRGIMIQ